MERRKQVGKMISYGNQPGSLTLVRGGSLAFYLVMWLALCLLGITLFAVDASVIKT